ncbi:MAG: bifunctional diguanylate cyclase/phosphodiesterase, partial [Actinomycetota bacterium]
TNSPQATPAPPVAPTMPAPNPAAAGPGSGFGGAGVPSVTLDGWGAPEEPIPAIDLSAVEPEIDLIDPGADTPPPIETPSYAATQSLRRADGARVLVHAIHTPIPSLTPTAPYVVVQYRDLGRASAETLLADQAAVIGSLSRGHELGRLCHQVSAQIEQELPAGSQCWLAIADADGVLEPIIAGELPFDVVAEILRVVAEAGTDNMKRVVSAEVLPGQFVPILHSRSIKSLWYVPLIGSGGQRRGAMMIATGDGRPDQAITRTLDHLSVVMTTAIEHATTEADIAHQRLHDPLTHLPNRALIMDRLDQALGRLPRDGIALSVLLVDIDRFRSVNDTRGAEVGDQVLLEVAARLLAAVRLGDTVGRVSSDQYLVMCVAQSGELDAAAVGRRILRSLAEPIRVGAGDPLHITASVGVVVVDEPGPSPAAVISNAESALARATASGRGQLAMFEADLRRHVVDRHETEQALHQAITQDELVIHYQPLVEIRTGYMVGAEALVRWDRPGFGLLHPPSFIEIAEESDLILPMGNWIIDRVCADLARWPKSNGRSPMVTINLAAAQLAVDTLVPTVVSALQRNGLHPNRVGFEITESMEIRDLKAAGVNLNRLSELGCRIAIDDFGIGHATLDYIRQFSMADALKIDRSFVAGLSDSKEDTAIVNASIALAQSLGLQVIAEGVENPEQLAALEELGCRYAQGFGLSRPIPLDDVLELWEQAKLFDPGQS